MKQMISRLFTRPPKHQNGVDLGLLTRLVRRYTVEQQQVPKDLVDLVSLKYLAAIPVPPQGRRFVIDRKSVEVKLANSLPHTHPLSGP
jgi:hypothetical protein